LKKKYEVGGKANRVIVAEINQNDRGTIPLLGGVGRIWSRLKGNKGRKIAVNLQTGKRKENYTK